MSAAHEVKQMRLWLGLSQPETAEVLGVSRATVVRWEAGRAPVPGWLGDAIAYHGPFAVQGVPPPDALEAGLAVRKARESWRSIQAGKTAPGASPHPRYAVLGVLVGRFYMTRLMEPRYGPSPVALLSATKKTSTKRSR